MQELGVIHGRFQLLHNDHLTYLLAGRQRCRHLVIGITNPEPALTAADPAAPHRSEPTANPFTYFDRYRMVDAAMRGAGVEPAQFSIVPFPINFPDRYRYYVPLNGIFFLTIYDDWGEKKLKMFRELDLRTEILWQRPLAEKGLSSSAIRHLIATRQPWEHLIPAPVRAIIKDILNRGRDRSASIDN